MSDDGYAQEFLIGSGSKTPDVDPSDFLAGKTDGPRKPTFGQWGWYDDLPPVPPTPGHPEWAHGGGRWPRVSTIKETLPDRYALNMWERRQMLLGVAESPELLKPIQSKRFNPDSKHGKDVLDALAETFSEIAGTREGASKGTDFHTTTELHDSGVPLRIEALPEHEQIMIKAYAALLAKAKITMVPDLIERTVFVPEIGVAGTLDRICFQDGIPRIGDVKTQGTLDFDHMKIPAQFAMYAHAKWMLNQATWQWVPMPDVDQTWGTLLWVPAAEPGRAEYHDVDLVWGWKIVKASVTTRQWRKRRNGMIPRVTI